MKGGGRRSRAPGLLNGRNGRLRTRFRSAGPRSPLDSPGHDGKEPFGHEPVPTLLRFLYGGDLLAARNGARDVEDLAVRDDPEFAVDRNHDGLVLLFGSARKDVDECNKPCSISARPCPSPKRIFRVGQGMPCPGERRLIFNDHRPVLASDVKRVSTASAWVDSHRRKSLLQKSGSSGRRKS